MGVTRHRGSRRSLALERVFVSAAVGAVLAAALTASPMTSSSRATRSEPVEPVAAVDVDWPAYERGPAHTSATTDSAITTTSASALVQRWRFVADRATKTGQPASRFDGSPTVYGGRVYIGNRTGTFYVLDAMTGAVVWKKQLDYGTTTYCAPKGISGTATVSKDPVDGVLTVYVPGAHYLYALNAATGFQRWRRSIGPATQEGINAYYDWSSPTVNGGRIVMGLSSKCDLHHVRGGVVSLYQHSGAVNKTWYDMAPGHIGGSVWTSAAALGTSVWVTTGNPDSSGTTLDDSYSIIRLDAASLTRKDGYQVVEGQAADLDFGTSPSLFSGTVDSVSTDLVGACNKNGTFYAFRRSALAAGPVWTRGVGFAGGTGTGACLPSPAFDSQLGRIFVASNRTVIDGVEAPGGLRALEPGTGTTLWEVPLPCLPYGSPTLNGTVVAVPMYACPTGVSPTVQLFDESDGHLVGSVPATAPVFAQPVFASGLLFVAAEDGTLTAFGP